APGGAGYKPRRCNRSARLRPNACTLTRTSPAAGCGVGTSRICRTSGPPGRDMTTARIVTSCLTAARPTVLGTQNIHRQLGCVRVRHYPMIVQILRSLLHLHVTNERSHNRLVDSLATKFVDYLNYKPRKHHW